MSNIPTKNIEEFFEFIRKPFFLQNFNIPEPKYKNGNISFFETVIICLLCKNLSPHKILEFGTFDGRTTINMAGNVPDDAKIITVDLKKQNIKDTKYPLEGIKDTDKHDELGYVGTTMKLYQRHDIKLKRKIKQLWVDTANFYIEEYKNYFDFIFIDASHTYENVLNDSYTAFKCIKNNGFILWHDYNGWPGVTKALDKFMCDPLTNEWSFTQIQGTSMVLYYATAS